MTAPLSTDEATALLTSILMDPQWSVDSIADLPKDDPFGKLCYDLAEIRAHVQALSKGDLSRGSKARGFVAGSLKATEANLRHLTWQMEPRRSRGIILNPCRSWGISPRHSTREPGDAQQGRGAFPAA